MPIINCYTNVASSAIPEGFEDRFAKLASVTLPGKALEHIHVILVPGIRYSGAGSSEPIMMIDISALDILDEGTTPVASYTPQFLKFLKSELTMGDRIYIEYSTIDKTNKQKVCTACSEGSTA